MWTMDIMLFSARVITMWLQYNARYGERISVRPSVCLSVCLSVKRMDCDKTKETCVKNLYCIALYCLAGPARVCWALNTFLLD